MTAATLLGAPITYDIVVSDFGRDAAIEYLRLVCESERRVVKSLLRSEGYPFFDEYRRLMFTMLADIAFYKKNAIQQSRMTRGYLTEEILIGLGQTAMDAEFEDRVAITVIDAALGILDRGHKRLRILVPCNGLSILAKRIETILSSPSELDRLSSSEGARDARKLHGANISIHTVPESVMQHVRDSDKQRRNTSLLVLGTAGVNSIYGQLAPKEGIQILPIASDEYQLIDRTIVASIGDDKDELQLCCDLLSRTVIEPRRTVHPDLVVLEACTDFRLGLGLSSLELFADTMVDGCYKALSDYKE